MAVFLFIYFFFNGVQSEPFDIHGSETIDVIKCLEISKAVSKLLENKATLADGISPKVCRCEVSFSAFSLPHSLPCPWVST